MAISVLEAPDKWVEIATSSPTSGSTVSFTSIPEYKDLMVQIFDVDTTGNSLTARLNNDTGFNYGVARFVNNSFFGINDNIQIASGGENVVVQLTILDANSGPKSIDAFSSSSGGGITSANTYKAVWNDASVVNRIDIIVASGNFTSGSIKLYGRS